MTENKTEMTTLLFLALSGFALACAPEDPLCEAGDG